MCKRRVRIRKLNERKVVIGKDDEEIEKFGTLRVSKKREITMNGLDAFDCNFIAKDEVKEIDGAAKSRKKREEEEEDLR
jgi:hypothetical protein